MLTNDRMLLSLQADLDVHATNIHHTFRYSSPKSTDLPKSTSIYPALKTKSERENSILFGLAIIVAEFFIFSKIVIF